MSMHCKPCGALTILALVLLGSGPAGGQTDDIPDVLNIDTVVGQVEFPHLLHVEDIEVECVECHHSTNAVELDMPHDHYFDDFWIDCKTCHVPGAGPKREQACSECHHRKGTNISDESLSAKVVIHQSCWECHEVGTGAEASAACGDCHVLDES